VASFKNPLSLKRPTAESRPRAELITVGTELLTGRVLNTNASYLGRELTELGFRVEVQTACGDETRAIHKALGLALTRSDLIFISGGLGPTPDDVTRESLAGFFGVPLVFSKEQYREIVRHYRKRKRAVPGIVEREAYFPANATPVFNRFGIALGFIIKEKGRVIIVVPGVPGELVRLFENHLKSFLRRRFQNLRPYSFLVVKTIGLSEPTVMSRLGKRFFGLGKFQFGIYPEVGEVALRLYADSAAVLKRLKSRIVRVLRRDTYSFSEETIESVIGKRLKAKGWTLAIAESCTAGGVSELIARVPGASRYLTGTVVPYQNRVKARILGVDQALLRGKGAVSEEAAIQMAQGVRERLGTTLGISVTGIAGPTGGTPRKPIGLVYIAVASSSKVAVWRELFTGDRRQIQDRAAKKTVEHLWRWIRV